MCVHAHYAFGVLHAGKVLRGAGNADVYYEVGLYGAAALAELRFMRHPAAVRKRS